MSAAAAHSGMAGFVAEPAESGGRVLVAGTTFAVCGAGGDVCGGDGSHGLFTKDARVLSEWRLLVDGHPIEPLGGFAPEPFTGVYLGRARVRDGACEPTLLVERRRTLGSGMVEELVLHNHGREPAGVQVTIALAADFADLFSVKVGRLVPRQDLDVSVEADTWRAELRTAGVARVTQVSAPGGDVTPTGIAYRAVVPAAGQWRARLEVSATVDRGDRGDRGDVAEEGEAALAAAARDRRPASAPAVQVRPPRAVSVHADSLALTAALSRSQRDLAALGLADPADPESALIAAGAPWFMALFGRDSLLTGAMSLLVDPGLALGSCRALARNQGERVDLMTEEQPGRILHELRFGVDASLALGASDRYYGSVDATPLFVMLVGQLARWGAPPAAIGDLLPSVDRALEWIERHGDRDGDGFVEYLRGTDRGLRNQGWKDSADGVTFADGRIAEPPIALVEVQAYVYGAYVARAELASQGGRSEDARYWSDRASRFKRRFNDAYWLPERGHYALGLDAEKRPIDALASNTAHPLWTGAADPDKAVDVAERLLSPELFSGYGIRTLAATMGAYNPASYHNGSVWPHDTAIAVAGLMRYGFTLHAQRVAVGLIEAASYFSGRLPELFCGFDKTAYPGPVPYPTSCSPQAWAAAAPVAVLVAMLGLEPDVPEGRVRLAPALPGEWGTVRVAGLALGGRTLEVEVRPDGGISVSGADGLEVVADALAESG